MAQYFTTKVKSLTGLFWAWREIFQEAHWNMKLLFMPNHRAFVCHECSNNEQGTIVQFLDNVQNIGQSLSKSVSPYQGVILVPALSGRTWWCTARRKIQWRIQNFSLGMGHNPVRTGANVWRGHLWAKTYVKMKELGPIGGGSLAGAPPRIRHWDLHLMIMSSWGYSSFEG